MCTTLGMALCTPNHYIQFMSAKNLVKSNHKFDQNLPPAMLTCAPTRSLVSLVRSAMGGRTFAILVLDFVVFLGLASLSSSAFFVIILVLVLADVSVFFTTLARFGGIFSGLPSLPSLS